MGKEETYEVIVAKPAITRYQARILPYLYENFSFERATAIDEKILKKTGTLSSLPTRGTREAYLSNLKKDFRFILYKETKNFELKIIYYINKEDLTVYITDFFPTKMDPQRIEESY